MKDFQGKVAVVTGAGGTGIGNALSRELARRGARLAICDVAALDKTRDEVEALGADCFAAAVDMSDKAAIDGFVDDVLAHYGHVDLVINNAGIALGDRTFGEVTQKDFERITAVNYWGVVHTTQRFYPHLLERPEAAVVNLSSSQGILALPYLVPYCTTKFAVRGFTDSLRAELAVRGVRNLTVHTVHPGAVATDITLNADYQGESSQKFHESLQRATSPDEAARIILAGVGKRRGRIFISDGRAQDVLARLLPERYLPVVRAVMRLKRIPVH